MSTSMFDGIPRFGYKRMLEFLRIAREAGVPVLVWGPPGIGKSSMMHYLCNDIDGNYVTEPSARKNAIETGNIEPLEVIIGSIADPTDILGFPVQIGQDDDAEIVFLPRQWAKVLQKAQRGVLFLDELTSCPPSVQNALLKLVLDGVAGDINLPDDVFIVAAANPPTQMSLGHDLTPPMSNRLAHVILNPQLSDDAFGSGTHTWIEGMTSGWHRVYADVPIPQKLSVNDILKLQGLVYGYLRANPQAISFNPNTKGNSDNNNTSAGEFPLAFATNRSWDAVVRMLSYVDPSSIGGSMDGEMKDAILRSLIGQGAAAELIAYMQKIDLPDPSLVLELVTKKDKKAIDKIVNWDNSATIWAMSLSVFGLFEINVLKHYDAINDFLDLLVERSHVEIGLSQIPRVVNPSVIDTLKDAGRPWKFTSSHSAYSKRSTELLKELV